MLSLDSSSTFLRYFFDFSSGERKRKGELKSKKNERHIRDPKT